ncbi:MAG: hypothetical protein IJR54_04230 [Oscillibacter sp.]|nr:hypothetical protein [Oscillibacter sp.]
MELTRKAVLFFEPDNALTDSPGPLALESVQGQPVLYWMARALTKNGVTHLFVSAPPRYEAEIRACLPPGLSALVSERHDALMEFLDTPDPVAVLPRAALPFARAGAGFAYAAAGSTLREAWAVRLTNAVQDASLLSGWVPLYGRDTLRELQPVFQPEAPS